jgi:hypothetical protein
MRTTSSRSATMFSPLSENITTIVNSSATRVTGLIRGMKVPSYQSRPFIRMSVKRVMIPPGRAGRVDGSQAVPC